MNHTQHSAEEPLPLDPEPLPEPTEQQLSDEDIVRLVDREMGVPTSSEAESRTTLLAFGVTLVAFLYVGILVLGRLQPAQAARSAAPAPRWVNWTYSFEEGQARARKNHTKVLIDFYTDWCPSCKWMDSAVYTHPDVLVESQNVTMVKINAEGRRDLAQRYNISVYPSIVWTDENGTLVARHDGSAKASEFASLMAQNR